MSEHAITDQDLKRWDRREAELKKELAELQRKREAYAVLFGAPKKSKHQKPKSHKRPAAPVKTGSHTSAGESMTDMLANLANSSAAPLSKNELKGKLSQIGFSQKQLGPYFYTVIMRLKKDNKITVQPDGKVWKAAA